MKSADITDGSKSVQTDTHCYHCGEPCDHHALTMADKQFCCNGCLTVYSLLHDHQLDNYYCYANTPGTRQISSSKTNFSYLNDADVQQKLISFKDTQFAKVEFYLPQMHCASCLWLLEHLYKLHEGIQSSQVNFQEKRVTILFKHAVLSLEHVATLLAQIGYEPLIDLNSKEEGKSFSKKQYLGLGITGFCFANIMLMSFPEYLGLESSKFPALAATFRTANFLLSLPVLYFGIKEFFVPALKGLKQKRINIDAPIAFAVTITFIRSVYEIMSGVGAGYFDSMSGIIFFMMIGRTLQHKTFFNLRFNRNFRSYFPISVLSKEGGLEKYKRVEQIQTNDLIVMHHQEVVPVDALLSSIHAELDYSFVTGESDTVHIKTGDLVYAGARVISSSIDLVAAKPFSQSSFTALWNNSRFDKQDLDQENQFTDRMAQGFSLFLLLLASISFVYWYPNNHALAWRSFTGVLIVACPCTLLLASSYTYGFLIQQFSALGFFVKNTAVLHRLRSVDALVFDKTGTLTESVAGDVRIVQLEGDKVKLSLLVSILKQSTHPLAKSVVAHFPNVHYLPDISVKETPGQGVEAWYQDQHIRLGSAGFCKVDSVLALSSAVYYAIDDKQLGYFLIDIPVKQGIPAMLQQLKNFSLNLISGDQEQTATFFKKIFPVGSSLFFKQTPQMKLDYIKQLQQEGKTVAMIGDGLNDTGALKQSDVGIAVVKDHFSFNPASDVILHQNQLHYLPQFLKVNKQIRNWIITLFIYSLFYNAIGLSYAVSANLNPMIAAILMPISSISVIALSYLGVRKISGLQLPDPKHDKNHTAS